MYSNLIEGTISFEPLANSSGSLTENFTARNTKFMIVPTTPSRGFFSMVGVIIMPLNIDHLVDGLKQHKYNSGTKLWAHSIAPSNDIFSWINPFFRNFQEFINTTKCCDSWVVTWLARNCDRICHYHSFLYPVVATGCEDTETTTPDVGTLYFVLLSVFVTLAVVNLH